MSVLGVYSYRAQIYNALMRNRLTAAAYDLRTNELLEVSIALTEELEKTAQSCLEKIMPILRIIYKNRLII